VFLPGYVTQPGILPPTIGSVNLTIVNCGYLSYKLDRGLIFRTLQHLHKLGRVKMDNAMILMFPRSATVLYAKFCRVPKGGQMESKGVRGEAKACHQVACTVANLMIFLRYSSRKPALKIKSEISSHTIINLHIYIEPLKNHDHTLHFKFKVVLHDCLLYSKLN
jgi:hypothetical protein